MPTTALISGPDICRRLGISYRILDYWDRQDVLTPHRPAYGSGTQRGYSDDDLAIGLVLANLRSMGAGCDVLRHVADQLRAVPVHTWPDTITLDARGRITPTLCCGGWVVPTRTLCHR